MQLQFLGATRQVTGSCSLLEAGGLRIMIDCGLFQERAFLGRNWEVPTVDPGSIDVLLLTHGHLDHTGLVPRLVAWGYSGRIIATEPTVELSALIMRDSARIHEEDVAYKRKRHKREGRQGRYDIQPLYRIDDAEAATRLLEGVPYQHAVALNDQVSIVFHEAGHILGSAIIEIIVQEDGVEQRLVFSGDLGQWDKPLIGDPTLLDRADWVVMESTYGDRNHRESGTIEDQLASAINRAAKGGGNVVIPTFAVERAQELVYHVSQLVHADRIPDLPIYLDSPMAIDVTDVFRRYRHYLDEETKRLFDEKRSPFRFQGMRYTRTAKQSKAINKQRGPCVIMATSGMCTAGRIKHHLRNNIERPESVLLFVGYQAHGTLGRQILEKRRKIRIHGHYYERRAYVDKINGLSAHADRDDLLRWLGHFRDKPQRVFLTHGEEDNANALAQTIRDELGMSVVVPRYRQRAKLQMSLANTQAE